MSYGNNSPCGNSKTLSLSYNTFALQPWHVLALQVSRNHLKAGLCMTPISIF